MRRKVFSIITSLTLVCTLVAWPAFVCSAHPTVWIDNKKVNIELYEASNMNTPSDEYVFQLAEDIEIEGIDKLQCVDALCEDAKLYRTDSIELIEKLDSIDAIEDYEVDGKVYLFGMEDEISSLNSQDYRSAMLGYNYINENNITGEGVKIAVIDSGLSDDFSDHTDATIFTGENYLVDEDDENRNNVTDNIGHGTFLTSIICGENVGLASGVTILPLKCFDEMESSYSCVIEAINKAIEEECDVINLSMGSTTEYPLLEEAVQLALDRGIIVVASSGNLASGRSSTGNDALYYPASHDGVISVGAVNSSKIVWKRSVQNPKVCVVAPGVNVDGFYANSAQINAGSGTSYSAPVVTATAALAISEDNSITSDSFTEMLISTSEDLGQEGRDNSYGYGLINPALLLATIREDRDSLILTTWDGKVGITAFLGHTDSLNFISSYDENEKMLTISQASRLCSFEISNEVSGIKVFELDNDNYFPLHELRAK